MKKFLVLTLFLIVSSLSFSIRMSTRDYCIGIGNPKFTLSHAGNILSTEVKAKLCRFGNKVYRNKTISAGNTSGIIYDDYLDFRKKLILVLNTEYSRTIENDEDRQMKFSNNEIFIGRGTVVDIEYLEDSNYFRLVKEEDLRAVYGN